MTTAMANQGPIAIDDLNLGSEPIRVQEIFIGTTDVPNELVRHCHSSSSSFFIAIIIVVVDDDNDNDSNNNVDDLLFLNSGRRRGNHLSWWCSTDHLHRVLHQFSKVSFRHRLAPPLQSFAILCCAVDAFECVSLIEFV